MIVILNINVIIDGLLKEETYIERKTKCSLISRMGRGDDWSRNVELFRFMFIGVSGFLSNSSNISRDSDSSNISECHRRVLVNCCVIDQSQRGSLCNSRRCSVFIKNVPNIEIKPCSSVGNNREIDCGGLPSSGTITTNFSGRTSSFMSAGLILVETFRGTLPCITQKIQLNFSCLLHSIFSVSLPPGELQL